MKLNDIVSAKLTDRGIYVWEGRATTSSLRENWGISNNRVTCPLWMFMQVFGDSVHPDMLNPVVVSIGNITDAIRSIKSNVSDEQILDIAKELHLDIGIKNAAWHPALVKLVRKVQEIQQ